jgi:hypothetical protein
LFRTVFLVLNRNRKEQQKKNAPETGAGFDRGRIYREISMSVLRGGTRVEDSGAWQVSDVLGEEEAARSPEEEQDL